MKQNSESDVRFQGHLNTILKSMHLAHGALVPPPLSPKKQATEEIRSTISDGLDVIPATDTEKVLIGKLLDLRTHFVLAVWINAQVKLSKKVSVRWQDETNSTFAAFVSLRDSSEAQAFLQQNPYFFTKIDRQIFVDMKDAVVAYVEEEVHLLS